ncbi:MAG: stage II sporulation protein R [Clostridia bacterium]
MKRKSMILCIIAILLLSGWAHAGSAATTPDVLRLHIIANSDSKEDQRVKLMVRDALLASQADHMRAVLCKADAEAMVKQDAHEIADIVESTLRSNGFEYGARLAVGDYEFPQKQYGEQIYPAGEYRALRVVLGKGQGKNWWCVMFPPLCILELPDGEIDYETFKFDSYLMELLKKADGGKLWEKLQEKLR